MDSTLGRTAGATAAGSGMRSSPNSGAGRPLRSALTAISTHDVRCSIACSSGVCPSSSRRLSSTWHHAS
jgi:hypothetical protein